MRLKDVFDQINDGLRVENILLNLELAFLQLVEVKHVLDEGVDQMKHVDREVAILDCFIQLRLSQRGILRESLDDKRQEQDDRLDWSA